MINPNIPNNVINFSGSFIFRTGSFAAKVIIVKSMGTGCEVKIIEILEQGGQGFSDGETVEALYAELTPEE